MANPNELEREGWVDLPPCPECARLKKRIKELEDRLCARDSGKQLLEAHERRQKKANSE